MPVMAGSGQPLAELQPVVDGFSVVKIGHFGDGSGRVVLGTTAGLIFQLSDPRAAAVPSGEFKLLLDLRSRVECCGEQGLASFAFPAGFPQRGEMYVLYVRSGPGAAQAPDSVLSRFFLAADTDAGELRFDPASEEILLRIPQPAGNHNATDLAFGPDGMLYLATGDGGGQENVFQTAQDKGRLQGKILRIDPLGDEIPYGVPADNPFLDEPEARDELWALGLRNPWRIHFERVTGELFIADAGQDRYEEINRVAPGSSGGHNFGWSEMEGPECFEPGCELGAFTSPAFSYCHAEVEGCERSGDCAVVGAQRYRGHLAPDLVGAVVFVDYCSGRVKAARQTAQGWQAELLLDSEERFVTLGEDEHGELYLATDEQVFRIQGLPRGFADDFELGSLFAWSRALSTQSRRPMTQMSTSQESSTQAPSTTND